MHITTNSLCVTAASCRDNSLTCIGGALPTPPANDQCTAAISMAIPSNSAGTTVNATTESPAPPTCITSLSQPGVWYSVVGNGNQLGADLCAASGWDSKIFVYTGSCGSWNCVTGNDDFGPICASGAASATWCSVPSTVYYILVTGYSSPNTFTLAVSQTVATAPSLSVALTSASVCPSNSTTVTASGATTYSWNTSATTASVVVSPSVATVYTVTGKDVTGCASSALTATVNVYNTPSIVITSNTAAICPGGSFVITPTGAASYTYFGGTSTLTGLSATVSPIVLTNYTVNGTDGNGCVNSATAAGFATVSTLASPALTITASSASICPGFSSTFTVTGANTYTWTAPASNSNQISVSPTVTTVYTVSGTGTNVCNGVKTVTVAVFTTPTVVANPSVVTRCALTAQNFTATGASTYTWNGSVSGNTTSIATPTANSVYTVQGTNTSGCIGTTTIAVTSNSLPILAITPSSATICEQSFASFTVGGATTYTWNNSVQGSTVNLFHTASVTHTIVGTDALGCVSAATVAVLANPLPTIVVSPSLTSVCVNSPVSFTVSGANTFTWSNATNSTTATFTPSANAQYSVSGTDANGCTNGSPIAVLAIALPNINVSKPSNTVCANASGNYTATGAGTYTWSTGANGNITAITPTANGTYTVDGTDATTGCVNTKTFAINTYSAPVISILPASSQSICVNASASFTASGAQTFSWSNGGFGPVVVFTPSASGVYSITGKNQQNCLTTNTVSISIYSLTVVNATSDRDSVCSQETVTLSATGAQTYTWLPYFVSGSSYTISALATLQYTLQGTDANGCQGADSVRVVVSKCTGIEKNSALGAMINLYPNPSNGMFTIEMPFEGKKVVKVYTMSGALISVAETKEQVQAMNLQGNAKGLYYIQIDAAGSSMRYKVIVE